MKYIFMAIVLNLTGTSFLYGQNAAPTEKQRNDISTLINQYSEARENKDTVLLKEILTPDIDQLVSNGEWRMGIKSAVQGMLRSSATSPGTRTLTIDKVRLLNPNCAIVDCKYQIQNSDGTPRKMWSTFVVVAVKGGWKISGIRNMLPASQ